MVRHWIFDHSRELCGLIPIPTDNYVNSNCFTIIIVGLFTLFNMRPAMDIINKQAFGFVMVWITLPLLRIR